ncbi:MAG: type II secretion system protein [Betaproteobacteria bacterium]|nr:type II secretion system protein [Betaproteobacteria bacterium]
MIMFIIIVSIGVVALLVVFSTTSRKSADPMIQKQMLAIAEALLEEVESQPFTYCDPTDPNARTAASAAGCTLPETPGPEPGQTRTSASTPFNNVNDYAGLVISPITDIAGNAISGLGGYAATITVAASALNGIAATDALQITVTVTGPGNKSLTLQGHRTQYAPNAVP